MSNDRCYHTIRFPDGFQKTAFYRDRGYNLKEWKAIALRCRICGCTRIEQLVADKTDEMGFPLIRKKTYYPKNEKLVGNPSGVPPEILPKDSPSPKFTPTEEDLND